eukprot:359396-Chlamydomonas_euryale.AAC.2
MKCEISSAALPGTLVHPLSSHSCPHTLHLPHLPRQLAMGARLPVPAGGAARERQQAHLAVGRARGGRHAQVSAARFCCGRVGCSHRSHRSQLFCCGRVGCSHQSHRSQLFCCVGGLSCAGEDFTEQYWLCLS